MTLSFHPLKAGRRRACEAAFRRGKEVSIPSRRVGDMRPSFSPPIAGLVSIPSRRVGDLNHSPLCGALTGVSIPSRRVGDLNDPRIVRLYDVVSIPSRRVGDPSAMGSVSGS